MDGWHLAFRHVVPSGEDADTVAVAVGCRELEFNTKIAGGARAPPSVDS